MYSFRFLLFVVVSSFSLFSNFIFCSESVTEIGKTSIHYVEPNQVNSLSCGTWFYEQHIEDTKIQCGSWKWDGLCSFCVVSKELTLNSDIMKIFNGWKARQQNRHASRRVPFEFNYIRYANSVVEIEPSSIKS